MAILLTHTLPFLFIKMVTVNHTDTITRIRVFTCTDLRPWRVYPKSHSQSQAFPVARPWSSPLASQSSIRELS